MNKRTKEYRREYMKIYFARKKEEDWYLYHLKRNKWARKYYENNKEKCQAYWREYYHKHKEEIKKDNKEKQLEVIKKRITFMRRCEN